ncbi:MAG: LutB/LldF family L-lactate oxidation iron-sulfur protein [Gemmatimonadota bacterium]|nr:LutB/LldF family L-lactate oxidation iron-sulfur protein [Gemmatimonadota bacterium]
MEVRSRDYAALARAIIENTPDVRKAVSGATAAFDAARRQAYAEIDSEAWRRWAEGVKNHVLNHLDRYLEEAETRLLENGAKVHWAGDAQEARQIVAELALARGVRSVVKGKSMLTEEIDLNPALEERGVQVYETDLGEYILQLLDEAPSHILGPAIHRSLEDVQALFADRLGTSTDALPDDLAAAARSDLRSRFQEADMGISGGNFLVAETGTLALIENEGNIRLTTSLPRIHVALVGIEKLLPTFGDLAGFLQLTARAGTGQPIGCFVSLIHGPAREPGDDGPEEVHIVLVDNGRTNVLADEHAWETLRCVRCGACLNTCPVYKQTGGHAYGWVYSGPIGAVLDPGLLGLEQAAPLPFASSLCGACFEACPVRIPIPDLLLHWRRAAQEMGLTPVSERIALKAFSAMATHPGVYRQLGRMVPGLAGSAVVRRLPVLSGWTEYRELPEPSPRRFRDLWSEGIGE